MISTKKFIKMAKKWQRKAAAHRKRISWPKPVGAEGHFVVYTTDGGRFMIPLTYLNTEIFRELFRLAEEEFGVDSCMPITLPCDSFFMNYAISMIRRHVAEDLEKTLVAALITCRSSYHLKYENQGTGNQQLISSF